MGGWRDEKERKKKELCCIYVRYDSLNSIYQQTVVLDLDILEAWKENWCQWEEKWGKKKDKVGVAELWKDVECVVQSIAQTIMGLYGSNMKNVLFKVYEQTEG